MAEQFGLGRAARAAAIAAANQIQVELEQQPEATTATASVQRHLGVECDECGANPILGTRFKCLTRRNYDVCRQCWQDNHGGIEDGTFAASDGRLSFAETQRLEPATAKRSVMVYSLSGLSAELKKDATIQDVTFYPQGTEQQEEAVAQAAKEALATHKGLETFHIYTRRSRSVERVLQVVAEGLAYNTFVFSVGISIGTTTRRQQSLSKETVKALQNMMLINKTIRYLFVKRPRAMTLGRPAYQCIPTEQDGLEPALFEALAKSSLQTFRYEAHPPVSDNNKKKAWRAMETNPTLGRICATFATPDNQLEILTAEKKHQWMNRWVKMDGSDQERLSVLEEVRTSQDLDESSCVPALYRLVRGSPGSLLESSQEMQY